MNVPKLNIFTNGRRIIMFSGMLNPVVMSVFLYLCTLLPRDKLKMAVFPIFGLKWNIIAHNTLTTEGKQATTNGMNRIGI